MINKKFLFVTVMILFVMLLFCSCNVDYSFSSDLSNLASTDNLIETSNYQAIALNDKVIVKDIQKDKFVTIKMDTPNNLQSYNNDLFVLDDKKTTIYKLNVEQDKAEKIYSIDYNEEIISDYSVFGDLIYGSLSSPDSDFVYDMTERKLKDNLYEFSDCYIGQHYIMDYERGVISDKKGLEFEISDSLVSSCCEIDNIIYYVIYKNNEETTINYFSSDIGIENTFCSFKNELKNDIYDELILEIYNCNSGLYALVGINQEYGSGAVEYELWKFDNNGQIDKKYKFDGVPYTNSSRFFDGKLFYITDNRVKSIEVK